MYKYFVSKGDTVQSKPIKYASLIFAALFIALGIFCLTAKETGVLLGAILFIAIGLIYIGNFMRRITFDLTRKTFTVSYTGLMKKEYAFSQFHNFFITRNLMYGIHSGTDLSVNVNENGKLKKVLLYDRLWNTKKIQVIMGEMRQIMGLPEALS